MSNSIPDITLGTGPAWYDLYSVTGITPGKSVLIRNKSTGSILVFVGPTAPIAGSTDGWQLNSAASTTETWTMVYGVPSTSKVWIRPSTSGLRVFIQELD